MADDREPPPLEAADVQDDISDDGDLFTSTVEDKPASDSLKTPTSLSPSPPDTPTDSLLNDAEDDSGPAEISLTPEPEPEATTSDKEEETPKEEVKVNSPAKEKDSLKKTEKTETPPSEEEEDKPASPAKLETTSSSEDMFKSASDRGASKGMNSAPAEVVATSTPKKTPAALAPSRDSTTSNGRMEEEEDGDKFNIEITVGNPHKKGEGMSSYMVYDVKTITNIPAFRKTQFSVTRRFSDFLGIHEKLTGKHRSEGVFIPRPPEKSVVGMTKVKMSKEESGPTDPFVEKRRAALERFLNRTAAHPSLRMDPDFRDFLLMEGDLPKATGTSALSTGGVMRLFSRVGDAVSKMSYTMAESDPWFEERYQQIEEMDTQLRRLHSSTEQLVNKRQDLATNTASFARSVAVLSSAEEHTTLSYALSQLAEVEERLESVHQEQADSDFFVFSELLKDYLGAVAAVKEAFTERKKLHKHWKECEAALVKKREVKVKLELANKTDKVAQAKDDIAEWEKKVEKGEADFDKISKTIKREMARFDKKRQKDFRTTLVNYLEKLVNNEEVVIKQWEQFLPHAKKIEA